MASQARTVLGKEYLSTFLAGKEQWNALVDRHPEADVDFSGADFASLRTRGEQLNFGGYKFPKLGRVDFSRVNFGEGAVDFRDAQFGKGDVSFWQAQFGEGAVSFGEAQFGEGDVSFFETQFGEGEVDFSGVNFGDGGVSFGDAQFDEGGVDFSYAQFGEGDVDFRRSQFGDGGVSFSVAQFGEGDVDFSEAEFGEGFTRFSAATMPRGEVNFDYCLFLGPVIFSQLKAVDKLTGLSFRHSVLKSSLDLSGNEFNCVPDLTNTQLSNQLLLNFSCAGEAVASFGSLPKRLVFSLWSRLKPLLSFGLLRSKGRAQKSHHAVTHEKPTDSISKEAEALCRLKELAEGNRDHDKAHEFYRQEMRVRRLLMTSELAEMLDHAFDAIADYGNSISRPCLALLIITGLFAIIYWLCALGVGDASFWSGQTFFGALLYSMSQILPFVSSRRLAESESLRSLFTAATEVTENECTKGVIVSVDGLPILDVPNLIVALSMLQGVLSFVLLFLVGLGLRNRFRL